MEFLWSFHKGEINIYMKVGLKKRDKYLGMKNDEGGSISSRIK